MEPQLGSAEFLLLSSVCHLKNSVFEIHGKWVSLSNSRCSQFIEAALTFFFFLLAYKIKLRGLGKESMNSSRKEEAGKRSLVVALEEHGCRERFHIVVVYTRQPLSTCVTSRSQNMCVTLLAQGQRLCNSGTDGIITQITKTLLAVCVMFPV